MKIRQTIIFSNKKPAKSATVEILTNENILRPKYEKPPQISPPQLSFY